MYDVNTHRHTPQITIRVARDEDLPAIARVEGRDARRLAEGPLLIATVGGEVRAAISLADGSVAADPFHRTAELVAMLRIRAGAAARPIGAGHAKPNGRRGRRFARHPRRFTHAVGG